MKEECKDCLDETYITKYAHFLYLDEYLPGWTCLEHPDYTREWVCITNPDFYKN